MSLLIIASLKDSSSRQCCSGDRAFSRIAPDPRSAPVTPSPDLASCGGVPADELEEGECLE
jgi:hypothetical protein